MDNLAIYAKVRDVPEEACKGFDNGSFSGTDINPMWRIKTLTEQFGPVGFGWYYDVISERSETISENEVIAVVDLNLYIKIGDEWSKPIFGTGGNKLKTQTRKGVKVSDEGYKMALTDALSVACKAIGIGASVYWDKDKTKYTVANDEDNVELECVCDRCQNKITGVKAGGKEYTPTDIIAISKDKYNGVYCWNCMSALKKANGGH